MKETQPERTLALRESSCALFDSHEHDDTILFFTNSHDLTCTSPLRATLVPVSCLCAQSIESSVTLYFSVGFPACSNRGYHWHISRLLSRLAHRDHHPMLSRSLSRSRSAKELPPHLLHLLLAHLGEGDPHRPRLSACWGVRMQYRARGGEGDALCCELLEGGRAGLEEPGIARQGD